MVSIARYSVLAIVAVVLFGACGDNVPLGSTKDLSAFSFQVANNPVLAADVDARIEGTTVALTLPFGTDRSALRASFAMSGGTGWVSTQTFVMSGCNASWYHLFDSGFGECGGHDGDVVRHLAMAPDDCYAY